MTAQTRRNDLSQKKNSSLTANKEGVLHGLKIYVKESYA